MIGSFLGWPLLSVDPSYLVSEGLDRIQALANRLFSMLTASEQIVVLLDEFDEMGRDRSRSHELLSRFITTAMLPKLAQINQERKIVFLLATNYVSGFDAAFSRGGRFDMLIQIMPPNRKAKYKRWPDLRKKVQTIKAAAKKKSVEEWIDDLTYLECDTLASKLAQITTQTGIYNEAEAAHDACTLLKPNDVGGSGEGQEGSQPPNWKDTSRQERTQMRVSL
jgi:SpoVK/Ycf46/Vps4 family AAA+-type ATPase